MRALDGYLVGQSDRLVDYGERHRAGLRVGTALTEGLSRDWGSGCGGDFGERVVRGEEALPEAGAAA